MFQPKLPASVDEIHFDDPLFWSLPVEQREGAFLLLRKVDSVRELWAILPR